MTIAVCWKCGKLKSGPFNPCPSCNATPQDEEDMAISLAMCDHYCDKATLELMGADIAAGKPFTLKPETRMRLIQAIRDAGSIAPGKKSAPKPLEIDCTPEPPKKPWWRRLF